MIHEFVSVFVELVCNFFECSHVAVAEDFSELRRHADVALLYRWALHLRDMNVRRSQEKYIITLALLRDASDFVADHHTHGRSNPPFNNIQSSGFAPLLNPQILRH